MATGDKVRITRNDAALDIANGDRFEVSAVEDGTIVLSNGKRQLELPTDKPVHLDHAYATTVYSSQGLTMDKVMADMETGARTTSKESYYVAISRAKYEARIYTDDIGKLPAAISREHEKHAALEPVRTPDKAQPEKKQDYEKAE